MSRSLIPLLLILIAIHSCSTPEFTGKTEAEKLYRESEYLVKNGNYLMATEKLTLIKGKYPYSYYATFAELKLADVLFLQENYAEAAAAYIVFKDFHPKHKKIDYVVSRIGESFYKQIPSTFDRDLSPAFESMRYFSHLIRSYPGSEYIKGAKDKIKECEAMIRNKEKYIADFYYKTNVYDAARFRYQNIIKRFSDRDLIDHAIMRSIQSSIKLQDKNYCIKYNDLYKSRISKESSSYYGEYMSDCLKMSSKVAKNEKL